MVKIRRVVIKQISQKLKTQHRDEPRLVRIHTIRSSLDRVTIRAEFWCETALFDPDSKGFRIPEIILKNALGKKKKLRRLKN